jgi:type I restriction enzyme S subunit
MEKVKNIPTLRFPEFKGEWGLKKLSDLLEFKNGINASKEQYGSGYKFINVLDILNNDFITHDNIIGSVNVNKEMVDKFPVNYGDILFQRSSETREEVGTACVYLDKNKTATFGGFVIRGRKIGEYEPVFFNKLLKTDISRDEITSRSGGSTRFNVGQGTLSSIHLNFPSLPEQTKIALFLTTVDEKLQALKQKKRLLEQYKKGLMQKIFSQELRFKDDNGNAFANWEEKKLGEVGTFQTSSIDKLTKENEKEVFLVNYMNVYRHENINNISRKDFQVVTAKDSQIESCNLKKGDILFTPSSETPDDIGHSVVIFEDLENAVFSYHLMRFRPKIEINILYSHYFCNIPNVLNQLTKLATGSTRFTISVKSFSSIEVCLPCLEEQTKIATFLSSIDYKVNQCQAEITYTEVWKKGLLQQLFV